MSIDTIAEADVADPAPAPSHNLVLVSHHLCPYVQRAVISLTEKGVPFERVDVDLANKPAWFRDISPLGKVPLLQVGDAAIFESAVILEFLEETQPNPLHPQDPVDRARHRAWIEFGSSLLNDIAGFYNAADRAALDAKTAALVDKFARVERELGDGTWFDGRQFSLVDATFGPIFRYFDTFDQIGDFGIFRDKPKTAIWRAKLARRKSVRSAVGSDYPERLTRFLKARSSYLSSMIA